MQAAPPRRYHRLARSLVCAGLLLSLSGPLAATASCPGLDYAVHSKQPLQQRQDYRLANGIRVLLLPDASASTAAVVTTLAVGARDEADGETGYAHLFEHLMFRGSTDLPDGAYARLIDSVGGLHNAETHYDYTSYYASVPAEALPQLLWQEAARFRAPQLTDSTVRSEIATVLEETALRIDNVPFMRSGSELLFKQLQNSDYDHLILGSVADLTAATPARLQAFYDRHYRPERTVLVIAGRFDPAQIHAQLQRDWAGWQASGDAAAVKPVQLPNRADLNAELVDSRAPWPALALAWQTVPADHPDAAALSLLQHELLRGEQGLLRQHLQQQQLLLHASELPLNLPRLGLLNFVAVPRASASLDELQQAIDGFLQQRANVTLSDDALCELKMAVARRLLASQESPYALAYRESVDTVLWQQSLRLDELTRLQQVSSADLQRVLQQYWLNQRITLRLLPPWYMRWAKRMLEWLPSSWSEALEAKVL